jgi:hypothetical protein
MVVVELSPDDVLTFELEDISDAIQFSAVLSCNSTEDDSLLFYEVKSNWPFRYKMSPNTGIMQMTKHE